MNNSMSSCPKLEVCVCVCVCVCVWLSDALETTFMEVGNKGEKSLRVLVESSCMKL